MRKKVQEWRKKRKGLVIRNHISEISLIAVGTFLALIWGAVTFISFGIPESVCVLLDRATFSVFSGSIFALHNGFFYDVPNRNMPTAIFLFLFSIAFFIYFAIVLKIGKSPASVKSFGIVIIFSILFRLILLPSVAIHESDFYRYLWDGKSIKNGINPFKYAPAEVYSINDENNHEIKRLKELRDKNFSHFEKINHSDVPTIYPPVAQAFFTLSSIISEDSVFVLKSIFVLFDILVVIVVSLLLLHFKMNPSLAIIYGWSPLVLKEVANSGHYDSITIFLTLLSLYFLVKNRILASSLSLISATLTKFYPVLLLPLYIKRIRIRELLIFAFGSAGMYLPFFIWNHAGVYKVFAGFGIYSEKWAYNGSLFVITHSLVNMLHISVISDFFLAKFIMGIIFVTMLLYWTFKKSDEPLDLLKRVLFVLIALFLLNPVGEPWYFCWVIPFLCFYPYKSLLLLSWLLIFSYLSFAHDFGVIGVGGLEIPILNAIQYSPFFIFFICEFIFQKRKTLNYVAE